MTISNFESYNSISQISSSELDSTSAKHHDLVSFMGLMQRCGVDLLPIKWQPALADLGRGGSANVSQAFINLQTSFAFKRISLTNGGKESSFNRLAKEVLILCHPGLRNHDSMIRLEAYCCEILKEPERISPVLIFEKAPLGDLQNFMLSEKARNISSNVRLGFCSDIARALSALHSLCVVHGDIKPLNILVYEQSGKLSVKLADLGDASVCSHEDSIAYMSRSEPWFAPEYHHRGFLFLPAKKMDVYSFGLLCFWLLLGDRLQCPSTRLDRSQDSANVTFGIPFTVAALDMLKQSNALQDTAREVLLAVEDLTLEQQRSLVSLFDLTLAKDPKARTADFLLILKLLGNDIVSTSPSLSPPSSEHWMENHPRFRLVESMQILAHADRRIRVGIAQELKHQYWNSKCSECKAHSSFQVAFCHRTGFGQPQSLEESMIWLERSGRSVEDLLFEISFGQSERLPQYQDERLRTLQDQFIFEVDYAHEYRMDRDTELKQIGSDLSEEVKAVGSTFGEGHEMTVTLKRILAQLLHAQGLYDEAALVQETLAKSLLAAGARGFGMKVLGDLSQTYSAQGQLSLAEGLRSVVADHYEEVLGEEHMGTLAILADLAHTLIEMRQWDKAEKILLRVVTIKSRKVGDEHASTLASKSNLAAVYYRTGRLKEAESLQSEILRGRQRILGDNHESTWYSMSNLASTWWSQGRLDDAERLELEVVRLREESLGPDHPDTLTALRNLALTHGKKNQVEKEGSILEQVLKAQEIKIGADHEHTVTTAAELARNYQSQARFDEAATLQAHVVDIRCKRFGQGHSSTLASRTNLAWILVDQGNWPEAEAMQLRTIAMGTEAQGESHPAVLRSMSALASMYKVQKRLMPSLALYSRILKMRCVSLGEGHPDSLKTARDIETVKDLLATQSSRILRDYSSGN